MKRDALLLGFLATAGQILMLRELVTAFGGAELFIGTALFGWLLWVALGSLIGGRGVRLNTQLLFVIAVWALPISIVVIRLLPMLVTDVTGEMIPLTTAAPLSMLAVAPVGLLSGLLFPAIAKKGRDSGDSIASVYLYEGLGAFAAGLATVLLISLSVGNLGAGLVTAGVVALTVGLKAEKSQMVLFATAGAIAFLLAVTRFGAVLDESLDRRKFPGYQIERSFDTPYGHQTVLTRDSATVLLTDNAIEAVYPDLERAENLLIPPLAYLPSASSVLFVGRSEFGAEQLAFELPNLRLTAVDPRGELVNLQELTTAERIEDDPAAFLSRPSGEVFDAVVIAIGRLDSYRASRMVTANFLRRVRQRLNPQGVLLLATTYDTDRYISAQTGEALAMIAHTVEEVFPHTVIWPGNATLVIASSANVLDLSVDSLLSRIGRLKYRPHYVSEFYLSERLSEFKRERVQTALKASTAVNSVERPQLASIEAWHRARAGESDRVVASLIYGHTGWLLLFPAGILVFFLWTLRRRDRGLTGLFMYFSAGLVSLTLELISFYLFQSTAGSLHLHLTVLIGVFMLGLALGTWLGSRTVGPGIGRLAPAMLLGATILFALTWDSIDPRMALLYHALFQLVVALSTGTLFVAATRCYYVDVPQRSRGLGYALELVGSACGALMTNAVLLPILGVDTILVALASMLVLTLLVQSGKTGAKQGAAVGVNG